MGSSNSRARQADRITHSAIYRHFPSKEVLIKRVYEHVYLGARQQHWSHLIHDKSQMLEARLIRFYREYADQIFKFDWVRIFIFSGLKSFDINHRYLVLVMERIGRPALIEARQELRFALTSKSPISPREQELFWGLHGRIFYIAIRKFVYGTPVPEGAELQSRDYGWCASVYAGCASNFRRDRAQEVAINARDSQRMMRMVGSGTDCADAAAAKARRGAAGTESTADAAQAGNETGRDEL